MKTVFSQPLSAMRALLGASDRYGPCSKHHRRLMQDAAKARNRIKDEPTSHLRDFMLFAMTHSATSNAQLLQDAFVLYVLGQKRDGYFCEFGATNGVSLSNTLMLEKDYAWRGICAEPAQSWHTAPPANRPKAVIDTRCVWTQTGVQLAFSEACSGELATLSQFENVDNHARNRKGSVTYPVKTVSLLDLRDQHAAPADLDYL